jgi:hypothetical protein
MKSIVWLASYPKSGNTWLRIFLANYISNSSRPASINDLSHLDRSDANGAAYQMVSKEPFDGNNPIQSANLRPAVLKMLVSNGADVNFIKTHVENGVAYGVRLIPPELTRCAVYLVRNPLDMVVSYANHYSLEIDHAIQSIGHTNNSLKGGTATSNAYQFLGSWTNHAAGWANEKRFPVLVLRYEDMLKDPYKAFDRVLRHIGLSRNRDQLEQAIRFSEFKSLNKQENETGFKEKIPGQKQFFRSGKAGQWKTELTSQQVEEILQDHGQVMKRFGYKI